GRASRAPRRGEGRLLHRQPPLATGVLSAKCCRGTWPVISVRLPSLVVGSAEPTTEEAGMAVAFVQEFEITSGDRSTSNYDAVASRLQGEAPEGLIVHTAGWDEEHGVFRILDVWESR